MMKEEYIKKFGTKLLASSKSVNKIPSEYMKESFNARIFDGGIGCRKGKELILDSQIGNYNKGGFMMNGTLYQITNGGIYSVNIGTGVHTFIVALGYDEIVDVMVYKTFAIIVSARQRLQVFDGTSTLIITTTVPFANEGIIEFTKQFSFLVGGSGTVYDENQIIGGKTLSFFSNGVLNDNIISLKQTFSINDNINSPSITLYLAEGTSLANITVSLYITAGDVLIDSETISSSTLTSSLSPVTFDFTGSLTLLTSEAYYIKVIADGGVQIDTSLLDVYAGGKNTITQKNFIAQNEFNTSYTISFGRNDNTDVRQTFTVENAIVNPVVHLFLSKNHCATDNLTVGIYRSSDDTLVTNSVTILNSSLIIGVGATFSTISINFTGNLTLLTTEAYYIKIKRTGGYDSTCYFYVASELDIYNGGKAQVLNGGTGLWTDTGKDLRFHIFAPSGTVDKIQGDIKFKLQGAYVVGGNSGGLYVSRPITPANPEYAYDFTGTGSDILTFDEDIIGLEGTMNGLYIFQKSKIDFLGANSLQNVAGSATFITTQLGKGGEPVNNHCIASSGDKIFFITKNLQLQTVNYISGTDSPSIGTLSSTPIVGIKEFFKDIDTNQPTAFSFYNKNDETMHFHLRTTTSSYNDICLVYDLINKTFSVDNGKNFNYIVQDGLVYYGFSSTDSSIYKDEVQDTDNGVAIPFSIKTQKMNYGNLREKMFGGILSGGAIGPDTTLTYKTYIDGVESMSEDISGEDGIIGELQPFERIGDESLMYELGTRLELEISSNTDKKDFIVDMLGARLEHSGNMDVSNKF